ncbi:MAG TPA: hypothetical protein EYN64_02375 [Flavobacteriales bacterium]|nr:hypothetical protein [Flavobacteriales bacterium]
MSIKYSPFSVAREEYSGSEENLFRRSVENALILAYSEIISAVSGMSGEASPAAKKTSMLSEPAFIKFSMGTATGDISAFSYTLLDDETAPAWLTTLLITNKAQRILLDSTNLEILTELGIQDNSDNIATNTSAIATNVTAITTEATTRGTADTTLQTNIVVEAGTRAGADIVLAGDIATNVTAITTNATNIGTNDTDIAANTSAIATNTAAIAVLVDNEPVPNWLINGDFQVGQNGSSWTAPADGTYTLDQWVVLTASAGAVNVAKETTSIPANCRGGISVTQASGKGNVKWGLFQVIDNQRSVGQSSHDFSFSIDFAGTGTLTDFKVHIIAWKAPGVADVPTMDPISSWNAAQVNPTLAANWEYITDGSLTITGTGTFVTYKLEDFTTPASVLNIGVLIVTNDSSFAAGAEVFMSKANLVPGAKATRFQSLSYELTLMECERFFRSTFPIGVVPAQNAGVDGALNVVSDYALGSNAFGEDQSAQYYWKFQSPMVKSPTITTYNPLHSNSNWDPQVSGSAVELLGGALRTNAYGVLIFGGPEETTQDLYAIHVTADARF